MLWTRTTHDESHGAKAKLESAYLSNAGSLLVTVELFSSRSVGFGEAVCAAKDGYRQAATNQTAGDLSKGEKTLAGFTFEDSKFGQAPPPVLRRRRL